MPKIFFNTEIISDNSAKIDLLANTCFTPVRYLFQGRTIEIVNQEIKKEARSFPESSMIGTALAITLLVPGILLGLAAKLISCCFASTRLNLNIVREYDAKADKLRDGILERNKPQDVKEDVQQKENEKPDDKEDIKKEIKEDVKEVIKEQDKNDQVPDQPAKKPVEPSKPIVQPAPQSKKDNEEQVQRLTQQVNSLKFTHGAFNAHPIRADKKGLWVPEYHREFLKITEKHRYEVRDKTKAALLGIFKSAQDFATAFAKFSPSIGDIPQELQQLLSQSTLFRFSDKFCRTRPEQLLGRFDVLAVPAKMDYDCKWARTPANGNRFVIHHAAAINIGESAHAADFDSYKTADGSLDENAYLKDLAIQFHSIMEAQEQSGTTEAVWFPFGMGAFLRNLSKNDPRYNDPQALYELREKMAAAFIEAVKLHPALNIHLCLPTAKAGEESTQNYNAFIQAILHAPWDISEQIRVYVNVDSTDLAQRLANNPLYVNKVSLVNGANRNLIGNHWFDNRALTAIDENIHRRTEEAAALALILNGGIETPIRTDDELLERIKKFGGTCLTL